MPKIFEHLIFIIVLFSCMKILLFNNFKFNHFISKQANVQIFLLLLVFILLIGLLPIPWSIGGDRAYYARLFKNFQSGVQMQIKNDFMFYNISKIFSSFFNYTFYFIIFAAIYCYSRYYFAKKLTPRYVIIMLVMFFSSFSFYAYGTNTVRAGLAISVLLTAITNWEQPKLFYPLLFFAWSIHGSVIIPISALLIAKFYNKPLLYFWLWFVSIFVSLASGHFFERFFVDLAIDTRSSYLLTNANHKAYKIGFRWDFLIYSLFPVLIGAYYILRIKFNSKFYSIIYCTYLIANSFWILIIRSNFTDRFAYLSWFLYPFILIYPLLITPIWKDQNKKVALIVFSNALFTYFMFLRA